MYIQDHINSNYAMIYFLCWQPQAWLVVVGGHGDYFSISETTNITSEQLMTILAWYYFRSISLITKRLDPLLESTYYFFSSTSIALRFPSLSWVLVLFGWPPCQQPDMTLVEVSQLAYNWLCIRDIWLFVICMNFISTWYGICIYFCWISFVSVYCFSVYLKIKWIKKIKTSLLAE